MSALAAITRGDVITLTDLMVPEAVMFPTSTRDGVTTYRMRTREAQRNAQIAGVVERGFKPYAMVNGGVAMVWYPALEPAHASADRRGERWKPDD